MNEYRQTPDLPGEVQELDPPLKQSPLDSDNPWIHIWLPEDEKMGEVSRAGAASLAGYKYFLGHNGMICMITSLNGSPISWIGIMKVSWLKDPEPIPFDNTETQDD